MVERLGRPLGPAELAELARRTRVPVAALRGAISSYADLARGARRRPRLRGDLLRARRGRDAWPRRSRAGRTCASRTASGTATAPRPCCGGTAGSCCPAPAPTPTARSPRRRRPRRRPSVRARCPSRSSPAASGAAASPTSARARADGAYATLERALGDGPEAVLAAVEGSGCAGRGGAGFPTGRKWRLRRGDGGRRALRDRQRRRGRPGLVRRPPADGGRPARRDRGHGALRPTRSAPARASCSCARSTPPRAPRSTAPSTTRGPPGSWATRMLGIRPAVRRPGRLRARQLRLR